MRHFSIAVLVTLFLSACSREPAVPTVQQPSAQITPATAPVPASPNIQFESVKPRPATEYKNPKF